MVRGFGSPHRMFVSVQFSISVECVNTRQGSETVCYTVQQLAQNCYRASPPFRMKGLIYVPVAQLPECVYVVGYSVDFQELMPDDISLNVLRATFTSFFVARIIVVAPLYSPLANSSSEVINFHSSITKSECG